MLWDLEAPPLNYFSPPLAHPVGPFLTALGILPGHILSNLTTAHRAVRQDNHSYVFELVEMPDVLGSPLIVCWVQIMSHGHIRRERGLFLF